MKRNFAYIATNPFIIENEEKINSFCCSDGQLQIRDVTETDAGFYTCRAENNAGHLDTIMTVRVVPAPQILKSDVIDEIEVLSDQSLFVYKR